MGLSRPAVGDGPRLVVDALLTLQLVRFDEFWDIVPLGIAELKPMAVEAAGKAVGIAMGQACAGCTSARAAVTPVHNALWRHLDLLHGIEPVAVQPVVDFVAAKRGYRPRPIEVYYRGEDGRQHRLLL